MTTREVVSKDIEPFYKSSFIFLLSWPCICVLIFFIRVQKKQKRLLFFTPVFTSTAVTYPPSSRILLILVSPPPNGFNCAVVLEKTPESPLDCKEIQPIHPEGAKSWVFIGRTDAEAEAPILWPPLAKSWLLKRPWCWKRLKAGGEGDDRGSDGWMASPTQWTWVWVNSGSWWRTPTSSNREARCAAVHGVAKSLTRLSDWTELNGFNIFSPPLTSICSSYFCKVVLSPFFEPWAIRLLLSFDKYSVK